MEAGAELAPSARRAGFCRAPSGPSRGGARGRAVSCFPRVRPAPPWGLAPSHSVEAANPRVRHCRPSEWVHGGAGTGPLLAEAAGKRVSPFLLCRCFHLLCKCAQGWGIPLPGSPQHSGPEWISSVKTCLPSKPDSFAGNPSPPLDIPTSYLTLTRSSGVPGLTPCPSHAQGLSYHV